MPTLTPTQTRRLEILRTHLMGRQVISRQPFGKGQHARPLTGKIMGVSLNPSPTIPCVFTGVHLVIKTDHSTWFPNLREVTLQP